MLLSHQTGALVVYATLVTVVNTIMLTMAFVFQLTPLSWWLCTLEAAASLCLWSATMCSYWIARRKENIVVTSPV